MKHSDKKVSKIIFSELLNDKTNGKVLPFIFQLLLLFIALSGFVYCVSTSIQMPISYVKIALICFVSLFICALFTLNKRLYIWFLGIFGLVVFCILFLIKALRSRIFEAFEFCYNLTIKIVIDQGYVNYQSAMTKDITEQLAQPELVNSYFYCVIIVLAIVFSVLFTSTMMKRSLVWLSVLPCFIVLTPSLYFGAVPSGSAFCIFISGIIGCYSESIAYFVYKNSRKNKDTEDNDKNLGYVMRCSVNGFASTVVVLVASLLIYSSVYSNDILQFDSVRKILDDVAVKIMNNLFYEQYETADGAIGGLLNGDVLELKAPNFRQLPVMTVTTRTNTTLYLRGWIGDTLTDEGWKVLNESDTENYRDVVSGNFDQYTQMYDYTKLVSEKELLQASADNDTSALGFIYDTVNIKAKFTKSLMVFLPVTGLDDDIEGDYSGIETIGDKICFFENRRPNGNSYTIDTVVQNFYNAQAYSDFQQKQEDYMFMAKLIENKQVELNEEEQFIYDERQYRKYVEENYLDVPNGAEFLSDLSQEVTAGFSDNFSKALAIERYFKNNYNYSINFPQHEGTALEKIQYMIENTQTAYCTYYATAMTIMMRSLNIPARYVTGYHAMVVPKNDKNLYTREIVDEDYHAWVEVYFDGIGWITFDPTPGIGGDQLIRDYSFLEESGDGDTAHESESITINNPEDDQEPENSIDVDDQLHQTDFSLPMWLWIIIVAVSVILFLMILSSISIVLINRRFNKKFKIISNMPPTQMVSALYPWILRLLSSLGYTPQPGESVVEFAKRVDAVFMTDPGLGTIINILEMTQFSENTVDPADAVMVKNYFERLSIMVFFSLNIFKKYYYMATINKKQN